MIKCPAVGLSLVRRPVHEVSDDCLHMCDLRNDVGYKTAFGESCGVSQESVNHQSDELLPAVVCGMKRKTFLMQVKQHVPTTYARQ